MEPEQKISRACVKLPPELHRALKVEAAQRGEPLGEFVARALTQALQSDAKQAATTTRKR